MNVVLSFLRTIGVSRIILIVAGILISSYGLRNQIQYGWFMRSDLLPLFFGIMFTLSTFLPKIVRVNLIVVLALILLMEISASYLLPKGTGERVLVLDAEGKEVPASRYKERNDDIGYNLVANARHTLRDTKDDELIYEMTVTTDEKGRRITPIAQFRDSDRFIAFFGDSYTFGDGVNDNETLPYFVGTLLPDYQVYNYAFSGYGPQHMLALLEGDLLSEKLNAKRAIGVYLYIDAHVGRAAYSMRSGWVQQSPFYVLNKNDEVERKGNFHTTNPIRYALYQDLLSKSSLLKLLGVNLPYIGTDEILFTCRIIARSREIFEEKFPNSSFFAVFHPGQNQYAKDLKQCFTERGVNYLDYSEEDWPEKYRIPFDGHPNAIGHQYFASLLAPVLQATTDSSRP